MKEPIEYTIITLLMILLLLATYNILNIVAPVSFKLDFEVQALMDKLTRIRGSPENWDEMKVLGLNVINDFGLSSGLSGHLDKDKVNLITYNYLVRSSTLVRNPYYVDPKDIQHAWVNLEERGFIIDFILLLNVSVTVDSNVIRVNVFTIDGLNMTSASLINIIVINETDTTVHLKLFENVSYIPLSSASTIKAVVAYVELYSFSSIGYWVDGQGNYGFTIGRHLISPVQLNPNDHKLVQIYCSFDLDSFFILADFTNHFAGGVYVYNISSTTSSSSGDIDDEIILLLAYDNVTGLTSIFFTYPLTIQSSLGLLGNINLRYGGIGVPSQAAIEHRILRIGVISYKVYLYLWRVER